MALLVGGCKIDLYTGLPEEEANQMLALLMLHKMGADKTLDSKTGTISLRVEKSDFINAVEVLRQNGLPKRKYHSMEDLFPSGQLVTSPAQEQAKMAYLKEQQIEGMLTNMEGVISANVSIAEQTNIDDRKTAVPPSASVFIKYSPEINLVNFDSQIRSLVHDAIPGVTYERISLVMQPIGYRNSIAQPIEHTARMKWGTKFERWVSQYRWSLYGILVSVLLISLGGILLVGRK